MQRSIVKKIYWSNFCREDAFMRMKMLQKNPDRVLPELKKNMIVDERKIILCPASNNFFQNTFMLKFPRDFEIHFDNAGVPINDYENYFITGTPQFKNRIDVILDLQWVFYCEESVEIEVTPPYYHKTIFQEYGSIMSGSFNINSWFRPVSLRFSLWEGVNSFIAKEDEPICYLRFPTSEAVKLQEFRITKSLLEIATACTKHPFYYKQGIPLTRRYQKFKQSGFNKLIEKEIKGNLIHQ